MYHLITAEQLDLIISTKTWSFCFHQKQVQTESQEQLPHPKNEKLVTCKKDPKEPEVIKVSIEAFTYGGCFTADLLGGVTWTADELV